jgi:hypothetical protein
MAIHRPVRLRHRRNVAVHGAVVTYTGTSMIMGPSTPINIDRLHAWAVKNGAGRPEELRDYFDTLASGSYRLGFDFGVLAAQWDLETDTGKSPWWRNGLNPAGIGITGDDDQNASAQTWETGSDAAYAHLAHMYAYVYGRDTQHWPATWIDVEEADRRFLAPINAGYKATRLSHLNGTWAVDPENNYHNKLADRANRIVSVAGKDAPIVSLTIKQQIIPASNRNRPGTKLNSNPQKWITIHETANYDASADAQMHSNFVRNGGGSEGVSFHLTVDDTELIQMVPFDEVAYHAGDGCDSRDTDLGCYQSVAIETCVNGGGNWTVTKENLIDTCVAIIKGDDRLLFNGTKGHFSPQRLAQHNKWSGKNCPARMRAEGSWANVTGRIAAAAVGVTPEPPPPATTPAPVPDILPGLSLEVARRLFGQVKGDKTGRTYKYTATGKASAMWIEDGQATGEWPTIEEAWEYDDDHVYLVFEGGRVYYRAYDDVVRLGK